MWVIQFPDGSYLAWDGIHVDRKEDAFALSHDTAIQILNNVYPNASAVQV